MYKQYVQYAHCFSHWQPFRIRSSVVYRAVSGGVRSGRRRYTGELGSRPRALARGQGIASLGEHSFFAESFPPELRVTKRMETLMISNLYGFASMLQCTSI